MEYVLIGLSLIALAAIGLFVILSKKNTHANTSIQETLCSSASKDKIDVLTTQEDTSQDITIPVEILPAEIIPPENKLVEITDSKVLAQISQLIPGFAQVGNSANNVAQAIHANGDVLYRAIIPANAHLANSREMADAFRGIYHGADGIRGHANLVPVDVQNGATVLSNAASAAMGIASMVVGQYYMTQINAQIGHLSDGISQIGNFNNNEYRGRVGSLMSHIAKIAQFESEILENYELRITKIVQLDRLEEECTQLLEQASSTLLGYSAKATLDFDAYEKALHEAHNWYTYQITLLEMLYRISELRYTLHLGHVSREQCVTLLSRYTQQASNTQEHLKNWHVTTTERLSIDVPEIRRKRTGFDSVIHYIPGLLNDDKNFKPISESTASIISIQSSQHPTPSHDNSDLYLENVQLIKKEGKVFYLPDSITQ